MGGMEARRAGTGGVDRVKPAVDEDCGDRGPPILALGQARIVRRFRRLEAVNHFLLGHDADPGALHEPGIALANADRAGSAVSNVSESDLAIAVKDTAEGLVFIAAVEGIGFGFV